MCPKILYMCELTHGMERLLSCCGFAGSLGVGTDLEAGGLASSVVELFSQVDVVDGGWRLGHGGLVLDSDGADTVSRAQVSIGGATGGGLTGDVEFTVGGSHVGVWDGLDTFVDHIRNLVLGVVEPWFLASEVDVLLAVGRVRADGAGLEGDLDASGLAGEVAWVEGHSANTDWVVRGVHFDSRSVASFSHDKRAAGCKRDNKNEE